MKLLSIIILSFFYISTLFSQESEITPNAEINSSKTSIIKHGDIEFHFKGVTEHGYYLDGIPWIRGTEIILTKTLPEESTHESAAINGLMLNPQKGKKQSWDARAKTFTPSELSYPLSLKTNDILVKVESYTERKGIRHGMFRAYGACIIVDASPGPHAMAPAVISWKDRNELKTYDFHVDVALDNLPELSSEGIDVPSFEDIMEHFDKFNPALAYTFGAVTDTGYESHFPYWFAENGNQPSNYGRYCARTIGAAGLALICDAFTRDQKKAIALRMCQHGLQWHETIKGNKRPIREDGGHHQFHHIPMLFALLWTERQNEVPELASVAPGNILGQAIKIDEEFLATLKPHNKSHTPATFRLRTLGENAIDGNIITFPTERKSTHLDPYRLQVVNMFMVRQNDGAQALVTKMPGGVKPNPKGTGTLKATIDKHPEPPFSPGDVIYFKPNYEIKVGDYDWTVRRMYPSWYRPNHPISYRALNFWTDEYLVFKAMTINDPVFDAFYGYTERANEKHNPSELIDFPAHHDAFKGHKFSETFWNIHHDKFVAK